MKIVEYSVEKLIDPFGILTGDRYEFLMDIEVPEDDELFVENGVSLRLIYVANGENMAIAQYEIIDKAAEQILDFELEDDEINMLLSFCQEHIAEAD